MTAAARSGRMIATAEDWLWARGKCFADHEVRAVALESSALQRKAENCWQLPFQSYINMLR